jgi:hypothetical protein
MNEDVIPRRDTEGSEIPGEGEPGGRAQRTAPA